jgi:predicted Rdx family selenoprotein
VQTELFLTFPTPLIRAITLQPLVTEETGGRFRVWVDRGNGGELVWDRKVR